jgi:hypothetical protein
MSELTANVNWLAVIVSAVAAYALGWLWYSPKAFGPKWAEGVGLPPNPPAELPVPAMTMQAVGTFLLAWLGGITAARNALLTFILIVLTIAALMFASGLFTKKSQYAIYTESGYVVAMAVVIVIVHAIL